MIMMITITNMSVIDREQIRQSGLSIYVHHKSKKKNIAHKTDRHGIIYPEGVLLLESAHHNKIQQIQNSTYMKQSIMINHQQVLLHFLSKHFREELPLLLLRLLPILLHWTCGFRWWDRGSRL